MIDFLSLIGKFPKYRLDPNKRYLFARMRCGFNDTLVQLEKCRQYAIEHERVLLIDTQRSALKQKFDNVFDFNAHLGCEYKKFSFGVGQALKFVETVHPAALKAQLPRYKVEWDTEKGGFNLRGTNVRIGFDFSTDYSENLLVHEQVGGGTESLEFLKTLHLKSSYADAIFQRISKLGDDYDAVHIRHTDYKTDYVSFFENHRDQYANRPLLICTDSALVKQQAPKLLHPSTQILSVADVPDYKGKPLHLRRRRFRARSSTIDFLADLVAISNAKTFRYTRLKPTKSLPASISGFSVLAENLWKHPEIVDGLFACYPKYKSSKRSC